MSDLRANGVAVLAATIALPLAGRWWAELTLDTGAQVGGAMTLEDAAGAFRLTGTVLRGGAYAERGRVTLVGGAGRLHDVVEPHFSRGLPARIVASDLLRAVGERLSPQSSAALERTLVTWSRRRGKAVAALEALCDYLGLTWRVLPSGEVWIGEETWAAVDPATDVTDEDPADERAVCAFDPLPPTLLPGTTFRGRKVVRVVHELRPDRFRTSVTFDAEGRDPVTGARRDLARTAMAATGYHPVYPAAVVQQNADLTLDLELEPDALEERRTAPRMTEVPLASFVPGAALKVAAGTRVLVSFLGGDPTQPIATLFPGGTLNELTITTAAGAVLKLDASGDIHVTPAAGKDVVLNGGSTPVAKEGSRTVGHNHGVVFALTAPSGGGTVTGTITINSNDDAIATAEGTPHVKVP